MGIRKVETEYWLGEIVFLKTDPEQYERMVTGIYLKPNGIVYQLSLSTVYSDHYEMEISKEKNILKSVQ